MKKRLGLAVFIVIILIGTCLASCTTTTAPTPTTPTTPTPTKTEPIELKLVSLVPPNSPSGVTTMIVAEEITKASNGEVVVNVLGGPEVVAQLELASATAKGAIDMCIVSTGMSAGMVPEATPTRLSRIHYDEKVKRGYYDFLQPYYHKVGLHLSGEMVPDVPFGFYCYMNKKVETLQDFVGLRMGAAAIPFKAFIEELGGSLQLIPLPDAYTALERGVIEGFAVPIDIMVTFALKEVLDYAIDHPYFMNDTTLLINLDKLNSLPPHSQELLKDSTAVFHKRTEEAYTAIMNDAKQQCKDEGMQFIKLSPAEADKYINTIYDATWKWQIEQLPEVGPKLQQLLSP